MTTIIGTGEVGALHSREELEEMQRLPLQRKSRSLLLVLSSGISTTMGRSMWHLAVVRILPYYSILCGGSTDVPAVFSDTGLEFPEVREFVKSCENVRLSGLR